MKAGKILEGFLVNINGGSHDFLTFLVYSVLEKNLKFRKLFKKISSKIIELMDESRNKVIGEILELVVNKQSFFLCCWKMQKKKIILEEYNGVICDENSCRIWSNIWKSFLQNKPEKSIGSSSG